MEFVTVDTEAPFFFLLISFEVAHKNIILVADADDVKVMIFLFFQIDKDFDKAISVIKTDVVPSGRLV